MVTTSLVLVALLAAIPAEAGFIVEPAFIRLDKINANRKFRIPITVQNNARKRAEVLDIFVQSTEQSADGKKKYSSKRSTTSLIDWATATPKQLTLAPGEKKTIHLAVKVPSGIGGDFRAALMIAQNEDAVRAALAGAPSALSAAQLEQGKKKGKADDNKITTTVLSLIQVAVPIVLRVEGGGRSSSALRATSRPNILFGPLKIKPAPAGKGALAMSVLAQN